AFASRFLAVKSLEPLVLAFKDLVFPTIFISDAPLRSRVVFLELILFMLIFELPLLFTSRDLALIALIVKSDDPLETKLTFLLSKVDSTFTLVLPLVVMASNSL